ncbi:MAG: hypothetical protein ABI461_07475, partial [Polyangiaceae bacterium]
MQRRSLTKHRLTHIACLSALTALAATLADCAKTDPPTTTALAPTLADPNARVQLPLFADQPLTLRDPHSEMTVTSRLQESVHSARISKAGAFVYANAVVGGGSILLKTTERGAEDFVTVPSPALGSLSYELTLDAHVAGLRLVENSLEFLDRDGYQRLRVEKPYLVDSSKKRLPITLTVEGCNLSISPAAPFHRAVVDPGSRSCVVRLTWNPASVAYPIVVDPAWSTTGTMSTPRYQHVAIRLPSGALLVAGGFTGDPSTSQVTTASAEVYSGGVWATTQSLLETRAIGAAAALANGDVLVTGGLNQDSTGQNILGTSAIY